MKLEWIRIATLLLGFLTLFLASVTLTLPYKISATPYEPLSDNGETVLIVGSVVEVQVVLKGDVEQLKPTTLLIRAGDALASPYLEVRCENGSTIVGSREVSVPVDLRAPPVLARLIGTVTSQGRVTLLSVEALHGQQILQEFVIVARVESREFLKLHEAQSSAQRNQTLYLGALFFAVGLVVALIRLSMRYRGPPDILRREKRGIGPR